MPVERIFALPDRFEILRAEAAAEGFNHIETLWTEWQHGTNRFSRWGEMLAAASIDGDLAGIGGITEDFVDRAGLRMRRFYVRPRFRRQGVARELATFLIDQALPLSRPIALHTETTEGATFWETMGFVRVEREKTTHLLR